MLGFFPTPYPDELLYSLIARYHLRSGSISPKITLSELFGSTSTIATIDLPANLNNLTKRLQHLTPNHASDPGWFHTRKEKSIKKNEDRLNNLKQNGI